MFYDLSKEDRAKLVAQIQLDLHLELKNRSREKTIQYFSDADTYIRKAAYLGSGRIYFNDAGIKSKMLLLLQDLSGHEYFHVRQTAVNAAGEIGMREFEAVKSIFDKCIFDEHHAVRNAVIGSVKKMGQKNPGPVLIWSEQFLSHPDKEIRREICHGIELRGRTHPEEILPLLKQLEFDKTARVSNTLVHVIGQIAYKKGCLPKVIEHLKSWKNEKLVAKALEEIIDVHHRYKDFAVMTREEARNYISKNF